MQPALLRLATHDQTRAVRQVEGDPPGPIGPVLELEAADGAEREARDHRLGTLSIKTQVCYRFRRLGGVIWEISAEMRFDG